MYFQLTTENSGSKRKKWERESGRSNMKISNLKIRQIESDVDKSEAFYEDSLVVGPTDIYPHFKRPKGKISVVPYPIENDRYRMTQNFLQIDTDEGVSGVVGPIANIAPAFYLVKQLKPILINQDPFATEYLWEIMYRSAVYGNKGENMHAISYADIALWDIKAKWLNLPLYKLLGGPVQQSIPGYANMAGYSHDTEKVRKRVRELLNAGYTATKWYPQYGPAHGEEGIRKMVDLVRTIRETAGFDMKIMIDAWNSWDVPYTLKVVKHLEEYDIYWIEEPVMPDLIGSYVRLASLSSIPIAGGEHEYTRWGFKNLIERQAMHVYQPDPAWCGGISELMKICALFSAYDVKLAIHGSLTPVAVHMSCACSPALVSLVEYLMLISDASQYFLKNPVKATRGYFSPPETPGAGMDLDENRIETEQELKFN